MSRRLVLVTALIIVVIGVLGVTVRVQAVEASGTIFIRADGSVDPSAAPISSVDNVTYTFTDNINDSVVVERSNIIINGAGYTVQGAGSGIGIGLSWRSNVTIKNTNIKGFELGVNIFTAPERTYMRISGNNITNNGSGIRLYRSSSNSIYGNNITNNDAGIILELGSNYNNISGNNITNNELGIQIERSYANSIYGNNIKANNEYGILLWIGKGNTIYGNNITNNAFAIKLSALDSFYSAYGNSVYGNNITNNGSGIELSYDTNYTSIYGNNIKANSAFAIRLYGPSNISVYGNNITNNAIAIRLYGSSNNNVYGNNITNNERGIELEASQAYEPEAGHEYEYNIVLRGSSNNKFYHNNFINNTEQVLIYSSGCANFWDDGNFSGGNYWSDYTGQDANKDGMGDTPYVIDKDNQDNYPIMSQWSSAWSPRPAVEEEAPFWMRWWFWTIVAIGIVALTGAVYFLKKRKPPTPTAPTLPTQNTRN